MEQKEKITKVYSNNSKKSRLKRNKNKFQRIWDAEKQMYVKVRKSGYPVRVHTKSILTEKDIDVKMAATKRHQQNKGKTRKLKKSVPVAAKQKTETKVVKQPARVASIAQKPVQKTIKMYGKTHVWNNEAMKYLEAA